MKDCRTENASTECALAGGPLAGTYFSKGQVDFNRGAFSYLAVEFSPEQFGDVRDNLMAAYGPPCQKEVGETETVLGPVRSNDRLLWCFRDGDLVLEEASYGQSGQSMIEFPASSRDRATATSPDKL